jgi:hypothetical protein
MRMNDRARTRDLWSPNPQSLRFAARKPRVLQVFYTTRSVPTTGIGCHRQSDRLSGPAISLTHTVALGGPPVAGGVSSTSC